jgi:hypothetical protein
LRLKFPQRRAAKIKVDPSQQHGIGIQCDKALHHGCDLRVTTPGKVAQQKPRPLSFKPDVPSGKAQAILGLRCPGQPQEGQPKKGQRQD